MTKGKELAPLGFGGIKVDIPVIGEIDVPIKVRISGRFIPDVILDPTQPGGKASFLIELIQPEVYIQVGNKFWKIDYKGNMSPATAQEFYRPTFFDQWEQLDPMTKAAIIGVIGFAAYQILKCLL